MPRTPTDYAKILMYKIYKPDETDVDNIYIGHTTDFSCRKSHHKSSCNNPKSTEYNQKKYQYIRGNGGWGCFKMLEIEKYSCKDANRKEHVDELKEKRIEYKKINPDKIKEQRKK